MTAHEIDQEKSEAFSDRMGELFNSASIALMTSIGYQTGLFDTMADLPPATSGQIAVAAGLHERYVREWLAIMATGRIVDYDPADRSYRLPQEHAAWLIRRAGSKNVAMGLSGLQALAALEQDIVECFLNGGGIPFSSYKRFLAIVAQGSNEFHGAVLIDTILPLVAGLTGRLQTGIAVADIGCGQGHVSNLMARHFPSSRFTGIDFSEEGIAVARKEAEALGLSNVSFELRDAATLEASEQFAFIYAFEAIHDMAQPALALQRIASALKPGGTFLMVEPAASSKLEENLDLSLGAYLYTVSIMHCMPVSLALDGAGLGTAWGRQLARQMLAEAGFDQVELKQIEADPLHDYYVATKR